MSAGLPSVTFMPSGGSPQAPFRAAVVIPTLLRDSLSRAVRSVFGQKLQGRVQILIGIDRPQGDSQILRQLAAECPSWCAMTVLHLGYSTSQRHGGLYRAGDGGAMRTILSFAANSRYVAYLDDDNWWAENHLSTLLDAAEGKDWAFSLRWFVDERTLEPLALDIWESTGPNAGVFAEKFGGFVDPNCLMIDKVACEGVLSAWCHPLATDRKGMSTDRTVFAWLKSKPAGATGKATAYYVMHAPDVNHALRLERIRLFKTQSR